MVIRLKAALFEQKAGEKVVSFVPTLRREKWADVFPCQRGIWEVFLKRGSKGIWRVQEKGEGQEEEEGIERATAEDARARRIEQLL